MANFKRIVILLLPMCFGCGSISAQTFHGFQTPSQKGLFISLSWTGECQLGVGYTHRFFNTTPNIVQAELRFPVAKGIQPDNFQAIAGVYRTPLKSRSFLGHGLHARYTRKNEGGEKLKVVQLAATVLPSYTWLNSLSDKPYSTAGIRFTYAPTIWSNNGKEWFPGHQVEAGLHADVHLLRSFLGSVNAARAWSFIEGEKKSFNSIDVYCGSIYRTLD